MTTITLSGMQVLEDWALTRVDAERLRLIKYEPDPAAISVASFMALGDLSSYLDPNNPKPLLKIAALPEYLDISRPSAGLARAHVHYGFSAGPMIGEGITRVWRREEDGSWGETEEIVGRWMS